MQKNDFLQQVIGYEYPDYHWEKDNYFIRPEYRHLVGEVLTSLSEKSNESRKNAPWCKCRPRPDPQLRAPVSLARIRSGVANTGGAFSQQALPLKPV